MPLWRWYLLLAAVASFLTLTLPEDATFFFSRVMISTDVFARGVDVPNVSLVINYDLPNNRELYIHRSVSFLCSAVYLW